METLFYGAALVAAFAGAAALVVLAWSAWCEHQFTRFKAAGWRLQRRDLGQPPGYGSLLSAELDADLGGYTAHGRSLLATVCQANRILGMATKLAARGPNSPRYRHTARTKRVLESARLGNPS